MSRFKVENKPIKQIRFKAVGKSMWMIVALSGMEEDVPLPVGQGEYYIIEGKDWKPFKHSLDVVKGSALDLSFLADAPAGKYGRVVCRGGDFAFANKPDMQVKFYGSNLCFSGNYLEKEECEKLAENFVRYGYNSLRIHHHDNGLIDPDAPDSLTLDAKQLDKLDYLFYCMKQKGVYITTDIYVSRRLRPAEIGIDQKGEREIKALVPTSHLVMQNIKAFAKKWLEHVNPYTGLAWKDDPALYAISFVNENTMYSVWKSNPEVQQYYQAEMEKWVQKNGVAYATEEQKEIALTRFFTRMQKRSYSELRNYVKNELGCQAVFTDCNMQGYRAQQVVRDGFDYVDNHGYWDHPRFPVRNWSMPYGFHNRSVLRQHCSMPLMQMPTRIFGKPFTFTEYNYVFPNIYRSEGSPIMGAYAALQGWNAVYRFAFSHSRNNIISVRPAEGFDVSTDPLTMLGERIVSLMYLRGDVSPAKNVVPFVMSEKVLDMPGSGTNGNGVSSTFARMGLIHKVGTTIVKKNTALPAGSLFCVGLESFPDGTFGKVPYFKETLDLLEDLQKANQLPESLYDRKPETICSDTGEITLRPDAGTLWVDTARCESLVWPAGGAGDAGALRVRDCSTFSTVFAASLDGKAVEQSGRILVLHLTDIKNTQTKYANIIMTMLEKNGKLPHLVRVGRADIQLNTERQTPPKVWALSISGNRLGEVEWKDGGFIADTAGKYGGVMAYEIVWE